MSLIDLDAVFRIRGSTLMSRVRKGERKWRNDRPTISPSTRSGSPRRSPGVVIHDPGVRLQGLLKPFSVPAGNHPPVLLPRDHSGSEGVAADPRGGLNVEGIRRLIAVEPCWKVLRCQPEARAACGSRDLEQDDLLEPRGGAGGLCQDVRRLPGVRGPPGARRAPLLSVRSRRGAGETVSR